MDLLAAFQKRKTFNQDKESLRYVKLVGLIMANSNIEKLLVIHQHRAGRIKLEVIKILTLYLTIIKFELSLTNSTLE